MEFSCLIRSRDSQEPEPEPKHNCGSGQNFGPLQLSLRLRLHNTGSPTQILRTTNGKKWRNIACQFRALTLYQICDIALLSALTCHAKWVQALVNSAWQGRSRHFACQSGAFRSTYTANLKKCRNPQVFRNLLLIQTCKIFYLSILGLIQYRNERLRADKIFSDNRLQMPNVTDILYLSMSLSTFFYRRIEFCTDKRGQCCWHL